MAVEEVQDLGFDPDELRERYRARTPQAAPRRRRRPVHRDGREVRPLRRGGPARRPVFARARSTDDVEIAIIGGGFSGLLAAARLTEQGITDIRIIEAGGDFGGTWYWNRYPGAQCDTESYCYLPLLEELGYMPQEKYSFVTEIFEHSQRIGERYGLYDKTCFQTRVRSIDWDDDLQRWHITTNRDDDMKARFVVMALGTTTRAKLPGHPGHRRLRGPLVPHQPLGLRLHRGRHDRRDGRASPTSGWRSSAPAPRRSSACRAWPRTPGICTCSSARRRRSTGAATSRPIRSGWRRWSRAGSASGERTSASMAAGHPVEVDLIDDGWTHIFRNVVSSPKGANRPKTKEERNRVVELADFRQMNRLRQRVDDTVEDPATAESLKPYYRQMCKRPTFNDEFLAVLQPRQRHPRRCQRLQGRRADHPDRRRRQRPGVRGRLHHLRHGVRDLERLPASARHRGQRP